MLSCARHAGDAEMRTTHARFWVRLVARLSMHRLCWLAHARVWVAGFPAGLFSLLFPEFVYSGVYAFCYPMVLLAPQPVLTFAPSTRACLSACMLSVPLATTALSRGSLHQTSARVSSVLSVHLQFILLAMDSHVDHMQVGPCRAHLTSCGWLSRLRVSPPPRGCYE
jgi:hypothetical protein